jgi:hypothetical protein
MTLHNVHEVVVVDNSIHYFRNRVQSACLSSLLGSDESRVVKVRPIATVLRPISLSDPSIGLWKGGSTRGDDFRERPEFPQATEDSEGGICGRGSAGKDTVHGVGESCSDSALTPFQTLGKGSKRPRRVKIPTRENIHFYASHEARL